MSTVSVGGRKISKRHARAIPEVGLLVQRLDGLPFVTKIGLGKIKASGSPSRRIRFSLINGGLCVDIRGPSNQQFFNVYTTKPDEVQRICEKNYP